MFLSFYFLFTQQDLAVGDVVMKDLAAHDADAGINALIEYQVVAGSSLGDSHTDGYGTFHFRSLHRPVLTLQRHLDYENISRYAVTIVASVSDV